MGENDLEGRCKNRWARQVCIQNVNQWNVTQVQGSKGLPRKDTAKCTLEQTWRKRAQHKHGLHSLIFVNNQYLKIAGAGKQSL